MKNKNSALFDAIDTILWEDWDPIGINDSNQVKDEYRGYVPHLLKLKLEGADKTKITRHLTHIETVNIGLSGNPVRCELVAKKIIELSD